MQRRIVYAMCVDDVLTFDQYWLDPRFELKRPNMHSSMRWAFGDNIYHHDENQTWLRMDSHHPFDDGEPNNANVGRDTSVDRVLASQRFSYWGGVGPKLPLFHGVDICVGGQGHRSKFSGEIVDGFLDWLNNLDMVGYLGDPHDWGT